MAFARIPNCPTTKASLAACLGEISIDPISKKKKKKKKKEEEEKKIQCTFLTSRVQNAPHGPRFDYTPSERIVYGRRTL